MQANNSRPLLIISPGRTSVSSYISEVWKYRNLIIVFAVQEFRLQYAQTRLSLLWMLLRPLMVLALFTFVFDQLIHLPDLKYPYPLFALSGLLVWNSFSFMVNNAGNVIITNQQLVKKMYFPRIILVFSKMLVGLFETGITVSLLLLLILFYRLPLHPQILFMPVVVFINLIVGFSLAVWLSALTIRYRDLHQFVPTLVGFLIWLTPVFYPVSLIPEKYSFLLYFNPIAGVIQGCRWAILGDELPDFWFLPSFAFWGALFISGFVAFIKAESDLADYI